ncbi:MAG: RraA family protein, partial [Anaerolineae bacterium]|nr:RraA family protein [Anaerolineae bacterium]
YMDRSIQSAFPDQPPMVGFASTIICRTLVAPSGSDVYTLLPDQIERFEELSGPPVVVFQDLEGAAAAATFGEVMCTSYKTFGAVGLVTNAPGRDLEQVKALNFPIYMNGSVASHGYIHMLDMHVPVYVGGVAVYPDDLLHGDLNGVAVIPKNIAADVADACAEYIAAEQVLFDALRGESPTLKKLREAIVEKDALVEALQKRITSKH